MSEPYKISIEQVRRTGDILGIATVERLDRLNDAAAEIIAAIKSVAEPDRLDALAVAIRAALDSGIVR